MTRQKIGKNGVKIVINKKMKNMIMLYSALVGVVGLLFSPLCPFFSDVYPAFRGLVFLFLLLGVAGITFGNKWLITTGSIGCWIYLFCVAATIVPDEEYYYFNDLVLPSRAMVIGRFILGFLTSLSLFYVFGNLKKLNRERIPDPAS